MLLASSHNSKRDRVGAFRIWKVNCQVWKNLAVSHDADVLELLGKGEAHKCFTSRGSRGSRGGKRRQGDKGTRR